LESGSLGLPPTIENIAASIERRRVSNEWKIRNFVSVGILILLPVRVRVVSEFYGEPTAAEIELNLPDAVRPFRAQRIFGMNDEGFLEFDRKSGEWKSVLYDEIIDLHAFARC
jgi:hypothetical protein